MLRDLATITSMQLSINQSTQIQTSSISLTYYRTSTANLNENQTSAGAGTIKVPSLCEKFVTEEDESCAKKIVNQQVCNYILLFYLTSI